MSDNRNKTGFTQMSALLDGYKVEDNNKYISREFQQYGYELATELNDLEHKSLYIKLAKKEPRELMEAARRYVSDAEHADNKGALFMWKLSNLKKDSAKQSRKEKK